MSTTRQRRRRAALALLCTLVGLAGCLDLGNGEPPEVRTLDSWCQSGACTTTGSVRRTSGLTADSVGYRFGPGAGSLDIPVEDNTTGLSVLARGSGRLYVSVPDCSDCPRVAHRVEADYTWIDLASMPPDAGNLGDYEASLPASPVIELSVKDDGSRIEIADLQRSWTMCSVAAAGPR